MKRYIAGMKSGNIMQFGTLGLGCEEELQKNPQTALFHETPEKAIEAYQKLFDGEEPEILWELTPKKIQYKIECKKTVTFKDL